MLGDRPWLAADPTLGPWPDPEDDTVLQTGAWILPDDRPLSRELETFLDESRDPPIYFGFGSTRARDDAGQVILHAKLLPSSERDHRADDEDAAVTLVQARTRPDFAPDVPRQQILELGRGVCRRGDRAIDVRVAEHAAPRLHSLLVSFVFSHDVTLSRKSVASAVKCSGCSRFEKCAAGSVTVRAARIPAASV